MAIMDGPLLRSDDELIMDAVCMQQLTSNVGKWTIEGSRVQAG